MHSSHGLVDFLGVASLPLPIWIYIYIYNDMICWALHAFGTVTASSQKWMWHGIKCYSSPFSYLDDIPKPKSGHLTWPLVQHGPHIGKMSWSRTLWNPLISCFFLLLTTWWLKSPKSYTTCDVSKPRDPGDQPSTGVTNTPLVSQPITCCFDDVFWNPRKAGSIGETTSTCLHRISIYPPWNYIKQPLKIDGSNTTFLLGWPIFRSNVSFISRWFARFSFTAANIRLGLPRCLTLMNWSSWVRPKFVGSKMSRGLFFFWKGVGLLWKETTISQHCRRRCFTSSPEDVSSQPLVNCLFQLRYSTR